MAHLWPTVHACHRPTGPAVTVHQDGEIQARLTFAELSAAVDRFARVLTGRHITAGARVLLVLPNGLEFSTALLGALRAGLVAVPAPTPDLARQEALRERITGIAADCAPALAITLEDWIDQLHRILRRLPEPPALLSWEQLGRADGAPPRRPSSPPPVAAPDDIAFLQYTSGSTGQPKGVAVSHRALHASCHQAAAVYAETPADTAVTWVPLHHDMGLITGLFRPLFTGYESVLLSPREFARSPASWLSAVSALRGTLSSAPNFAYEHCVRRISPAAAADFDLSSWRVARNAGEVVHPGTADRFTDRFAAAGFRASAFCPSYGMAEATLTVTAATPRRPALRLAVDRDELHHGRVLPVDDGTTAPTIRLLSSGTPLPGTRVAIRARFTDPPDDERTDRNTDRPTRQYADRPGDRYLPDGQVGEILLCGPQLFTGYWPADGARPSAWHATGDLGFRHQEQLFVLGRCDDTLVHRGRNYHAADVRTACAAIPELRPGRCAALAGAPDADRSGTERVVLVAELADPAEAPSAELALRVKRELARTLDLYVSDVHFLAPGTLPMTTSGKIRVAETARRLRLGTLPPRSPAAPH
ncbi:AMP-binding protein [Kitasatospora acidiphila]|nr:AMP-binding protein [Kitasatospora acidiphila]